MTHASPSEAHCTSAAIHPCPGRCRRTRSPVLNVAVDEILQRSNASSVIVTSWAPWLSRNAVALIETAAGVLEARWNIIVTPQVVPPGGSAFRLIGEDTPSNPA